MIEVLTERELLKACQIYKDLFNSPGFQRAIAGLRENIELVAELPKDVRESVEETSVMLFEVMDNNLWHEAARLARETVNNQ